MASMFRGAAALAEAVDDCDVAATAEAIVEARRIRDRLDALIASAEVEFVRAGGHEVEGHANYGSFLRARCSASTGESRRVATRTKKLAQWPALLDAWSTGVLCGAQIDVISAVVPDRHVERFAMEAAEYLEPLEHLGADDTRGVVANWTAAADNAVQTEAAEAGEDPAAEVPQRTMAASRIIDDRLEVTGSFDKDAAHHIDTALRAATRPDDDDEKRSPLQRRADALVEICRFYLAHHHQNPPNTGRPDRGVIVADIAALFRAVLRGDGVRTAAQLQIYLDAQPELGALERGLFCDAFDGAGGAARTLDGHSVTDTLLRQVATNGILERLLRAGPRIIDHGRSTRIFTESQKRAMAVRDAGSRISGESPWGCHAHHSPPYDHGGTTDINNGYLKTRREHLDHHRRGFTDRLHPDGTITLTAPDGRQHDTRPPAWPGHGPQLPVPTTAAPAPTLPFRPAKADTPTNTGAPSPTADHHDIGDTRDIGDSSDIGIETIDWDTIEPPTEPQHEHGWEPLELGDDEDDPTEIARIDAYIRRRNRRANDRHRTGAA
jgi:hypothetical protein